jgi:hypothetical protein
MGSFWCILGWTSSTDDHGRSRDHLYGRRRARGGYTARALGCAIFTQGETIEELRQMVRDAVNCHFEKEHKPKLIRLHMVKDEVIVA